MKRPMSLKGGLYYFHFPRGAVPRHPGSIGVVRRQKKAGARRKPWPVPLLGFPLERQGKQVRIGLFK